MSMYGDYVKEQLGDEIYENDYGFATYRIIEFDGGRAIYIVDIYVVLMVGLSKPFIMLACMFGATA